MLPDRARASRRVAIGTRALRLGPAGRRTLVVRLSRSGAARVRRTRRGRLLLRTTVRGADGRGAAIWSRIALAR